MMTWRTQQTFDTLAKLRPSGNFLRQDKKNTGSKAGIDMGKTIKRVAIGLLVVFVAFFVISRPAESAGVLEVFWGAIVDAFWAVYNFFASFGR